MDTKEYYRNILLQQKKELEENLHNFTVEEKKGLKNSTGDLSSYDNHPGDQGSETYEREKDLGLKDNTIRLLEQINNALDSINKGEFGICSECNQKIDSERLSVLPFTNLCRDCSNQENNKPVNPRPVEELILKEIDNEEGDPLGIRGMSEQNAWEEVAKYGNSNCGSDLKGDDR